MPTQKSQGTAMREAAAERVAAQEKLSGAEIFQRCEEQAIRARFNMAGECIGYYDRYTGKSVTTLLPKKFTKQMFESYEKARQPIKPTHPTESTMTTKKTTLTKKPSTPAVQKIKKPLEEKASKPGRPSNLDVTKQIKILTKDGENPRREGCPGWKSFNLYKDGMTVEAYLKLDDSGADHLAWDIKKGFIKLI